MPENVRSNSPGSSPENAKQAWNDVGERFSSLGRRLSGHYREAGGAGRATVEGSQRKLEEAAREIGNEIGRAFAALGDTISDDGAKLLAACADAKKLERLNLDTNALSASGIKALKGAKIKATTKDQHGSVPPFDDELPEYFFYADIE